MFLAYVISLLAWFMYIKYNRLDKKYGNLAWFVCVLPMVNMLTLFILGFYIIKEEIENI